MGEGLVESAPEGAFLRMSAPPLRGVGGPWPQVWVERLRVMRCGDRESMVHVGHQGVIGAWGGWRMKVKVVVVMLEAVHERQGAVHVRATTGERVALAGGIKHPSLIS